MSKKKRGRQELECNMVDDITFYLETLIEDSSVLVKELSGDGGDRITIYINAPGINKCINVFLVDQEEPSNTINFIEAFYVRVFSTLQDKKKKR